SQKNPANIVPQKVNGNGTDKEMKKSGSFEDWKGTKCRSHRAEPSEKTNKMGDLKK
ncbi:hypothetical protein P7K49_024647, partial [Saguinus oedipus]